MSKISSITNIEVMKTNGGTYNLAFGFVTVCGFLKIRINVVKAKSGNVFVSWPQQAYEKNGEKKYTDLVSFLNEDDRKEVNDAILKEFNKLIGNVKIQDEKPKQKQYIQVDEPSDETDFNYGDNAEDEDPPFEPDPPKEDIKPKKGLSFKRK